MPEQDRTEYWRGQTEARLDALAKTLDDTRTDLHGMRTEVRLSLLHLKKESDSALLAAQQVVLNQLESLRLALEAANKVIYKAVGITMAVAPLVTVLLSRYFGGKG